MPYDNAGEEPMTRDDHDEVIQRTLHALAQSAEQQELSKLRWFHRGVVLAVALGNLRCNCQTAYTPYNDGAKHDPICPVGQVEEEAREIRAQLDRGE